MNVLVLLCLSAMAITIIGCILNVRRRWEAFLLWEIANLLMLVYNVITGDWVQFSYFVVLSIVSGWGLWDRLRTVKVDGTSLTK